MLLSVKEGLCKPDRRFLGEVKHLEAIVDSLEASIRGYLTSLDTDGTSETDERRMNRILLFVTHVERAADAADRDLLGLIGKMSEKGVTFPAEVQAALADLIDRVIANARASDALLMNPDERTARRLVAEKERFRDLEAKATLAPPITPRRETSPFLLCTTPVLLVSTTSGCNPEPEAEVRALK